MRKHYYLIWISIQIFKYIIPNCKYSIIFFNKTLYNNVITEEEFKHQTPLGAGMIVWANEKATLEPAGEDLNFDKV